MSSPYQLKPYKTTIGQYSNAFVSHKINDEYPNLKHKTKLVYVHLNNTTKHQQTKA
jgi:hypothetical protein